ncbi:MAG: filamentous hemagglutinin N-terminal domain-containing protein, partial [Sterolibacteriaceae bacterium]|nr:filamentous hemagglutinin N-terminal domain-containing protein [Sterolibacteriaceae bacterium]
MFKHATLNRSYRLIWCELHATWVAVAEFAGRRGKRSCGALVTGAVLALIPAAAAAGDPAPNALPSGGQVVAGQVGIGASGARMDVTQSSGSAIVNWDSFNIGSHAHVNFVQPGSSSVILNRVLGGEGSAIFGRMTANGNVFISNPGGILFAPGARVDVGGLVASSLGISDANFLAGKYHFERVGAGGTVANQGTINAANGGFVALIAPRVANGGSITASGGSVGMAAGDSVNLDFDHDGLLSFQVNVATAAARADNSGVIVADGGRVVMDVRAKEALLSTVLNSDGIIRARSLESRNGEVWLDGGGSGVVSVTGTLDASGTGAGMHGGMVKVLGDKVGLFGQATIDVSGVGAGGTALVGGNWQGKGAERNASATYVGREVKIAANAIGRGDGGKVVAWADGDTRFYGSVSARGGALGGEGGQVEVSGKHRLAFAGKVDTRAPAGRTGMLLLDPDDIDINTGGADIATVGDGNAIVTFAESVDPGVSITPASLVLLDTDVSLSANNDITFSSALSLNATRSLTAVAGRNITVNAAIDAPGGVDLTAGNSVAGT